MLENVFQRLESNVRSYCRNYPVIFSCATGYRIYDDSGREYLDFLSGAGALNYGHNNPKIKRAILNYLERDGVIHSLDMHTEAKHSFLERFDSVILKPRQLEYKIQFPGPTGTNAVEAALKLARLVTGRTNIIAFTNAFHGMTLGALAATGDKGKRQGAGIPLFNITRFPYDGYLSENFDSVAYFEKILDDRSSGVDLPAAIIVETTQAEGGLNVASGGWLRRLENIARQKGILLIVDDIQTGCGRTGPFFSFERAGITPDIVCMSKSISGYGLPMSLVLIRPDIDIWEPGQHNGTFRGNNLAFIGASQALNYWESGNFEAEITKKSKLIRRRLEAIKQEINQTMCELRGVGLLQGIRWELPGIANDIVSAAFKNGVIVETCGPSGNVLKLMPPLIIDEQGISDSMDRIESAIHDALSMHSIKQEIA